MVDAFSVGGEIERMGSRTLWLWEDLSGGSYGEGAV